MRPSLLLVAVIGVLFAAGVSLLLERTLTRVLLGVMMLANGANLLILVTASPGAPPIVGITPEEEMTDPLPQAMILTAIVITLGMTAFLLAMAYRSWRLVGHDEVQDDVEDRRIRQLAVLDAGSDTADADRGGADEADDEDIDDGTGDEAAGGLASRPGGSGTGPADDAEGDR